jgi:kexin
MPFSRDSVKLKRLALLAGGAVAATVAGCALDMTPFVPNDTLFTDQWHLRNTGQAGNDGMPGTAGEDLNVSVAWANYRGRGVRIAIVDDGLDIAHPDLVANMVPNGSFNYTDQSTDPSTPPGPHGTACAGLAAAVGNNNLGVTGVAMSANLVGFNLLANNTVANQVDAMTRALTANHIYSNSWGAADGVGIMSGSTAEWRAAVDQGLSTGRGGSGAIYTWAAGNGGSGAVDRSDYDGQANYHGVIAVAALNDKGRKTDYSEEGSNVLVGAFAGEQCDSHTVTTVDIQGDGGYNDGANPAANYADPNYSRCFNGTSAATPEVSGVVALMLEANPSLSWREVRWILAHTARKNDPNDTGWTTNGVDAGVNHKYGYGAADATAATNAARTWSAPVNLKGAQRTATGSATPNAAIEDRPAGAATSPILVSTITLNSGGLTGVEFVAVTVTSDHPDTGQLSMELISPAGTRSTLMLAHRCVQNATQVRCGPTLEAGHRFGIARLMGERVDGDWTLRIVDGENGLTGSLVSWNLTVYGY